MSKKKTVYPPGDLILAGEIAFMDGSIKFTPADQLIGDQIKGRRLAARLTEVAVAEHLSISRETYAALEAGLMRPTAVLLHTLALLFNCRLSTFFAAFPPAGLKRSAGQH